MFIQTETLEYQEHGETIAVLGHALDLLKHDSTSTAIAAKRVLVAHQHALMMAQQPIVKRYDPREERVCR